VPTTAAALAPVPATGGGSGGVPADNLSAAGEVAAAVAAGMAASSGADAAGGGPAPGRPGRIRLQLRRGGGSHAR
jgi:hypothetical protein